MVGNESFGGNNEYRMPKAIAHLTRRPVLLRTTLCALAVFVLGTPRFTEAQMDEADVYDCACGEFATCSAAVTTNPIDNLVGTGIKLMDLVLCGENFAPDGCEDFWQGRTTKRISSVQKAIEEIDARYRELDRKLNVFVSGHGTSGVQEFGAAGERIGLNDPYKDKYKDFVDGTGGKPGAKDKIKRLFLFGCYAAGDPKGQAFLRKLREDLGADLVKGWTATNFLQREFKPKDSPVETCGTFPDCTEPCTTGICRAVDTNHDKVDDACWCGNYVPKTGKYYTEGAKKDVVIPTLSEWAAIVMTLLLLTAGTIVFFRMRRSRAATA